MSERKIRHVEEVFGGRVNGVEPHNANNILINNLNMFKNKRAPLPPPDQVELPKIGNYQPKILLSRSPGEVEPLEINHVSTHASNHVNKQREYSPGHSNYSNPVAAPLIMGDKDIPIRFDNHAADISEHPEPPPRRKRHAPPVPDSEIRNPETATSTSNPLYGRSMSQKSDEERLDMDFEVQGGDINFGPGLDNPGFNSRERERKLSGSSRDRRESGSSWRDIQHQTIHEEHENNKNGIIYPYIPPPDYEEVGMTIEFNDECEPEADYDKNATLYNARDGEDYGEYMQEDDYEFDSPAGATESPYPGGHYHQRKPRPAPRPHKMNKRIDKKVSKSKKKHAAADPNMKRNTIRDFTYSDSKIGWGDRTVNSTSAKGRYIKQNKERKRIDSTETFAQGNGAGSYEDFLKAKNGLALESPNSSDSGVDTGEDRQHMDMYLHSQPKQMKHRRYEDSKPSMWQRLTWRFRKPRIIESERL